jgi:short-subunit dehydrogenase
MSAVLNVVESHWRGRTALVTGASSGIGRAFALDLAEGGCHLILTARRLERLEDVQRQLSRFKVRIDIVPADLAVPDGAARLVDHVERLDVNVDLLVNNAGIGVAGEFATTPWDRDRQMVQLNVVSVLELTKRLLPPMLQRGSGDIIFIGSVVGYMPVPLLAHYAATKAFVRSFAEALAHETRGTGVHITLVSPGTTATDWFSSAGYGKPVRGSSPLVGTAEQVAAAALRGAAHAERAVVPGVANWIMATTGKVLPTGLVMRVAERIQRGRM